MAIDLKPRVAKGKSTIGPGHDGAAKPGFYADGPGAQPLITHHEPAPSLGMKDQTHAGNLARDGAVKRHAAVPIHSGMVTRSKASDQFHFGGDALSRADSNPANPLTGPSRGKRIDPPKPSFGQRSRHDDALGGSQPGDNHRRNVGKGVLAELGQQIMREALAVAGPDHPSNMGVGAFPQSTEES